MYLFRVCTELQTPLGPMSGTEHTPSQIPSSTSQTARKIPKLKPHSSSSKLRTPSSIKIPACHNATSTLPNKSKLQKPSAAVGKDTCSGSSSGLVSARPLTSQKTAPNRTSKVKTASNRRIESKTGGQLQKPRRTANSLAPSDSKYRKADKSGRNTGNEDTPKPPPRSTVGIKRSVTSRAAPATAELNHSQSGGSRHYSLEKQRSVSSNSSSDSVGRYAGKIRASGVSKAQGYASRQESKLPKRGLKRPSSNRPTVNTKPSERTVKYVESSSESLPCSTSTSTSPGSSPIPRSSLHVSISPPQLRLNRSLQDRLTVGNRGGIVLSESEASLVSLLSSSSSSKSGKESRKTSISDRSDDASMSILSDERRHSCSDNELEDRKPTLTEKSANAMLKDQLSHNSDYEDVFSDDGTLKRCKNISKDGLEDIKGESPNRLSDVTLCGRDSTRSSIVDVDSTSTLTKVTSKNTLDDDDLDDLSSRTNKTISTSDNQALQSENSYTNNLNHPSRSPFRDLNISPIPNSAGGTSTSTRLGTGTAALENLTIPNENALLPPKNWSKSFESFYSPEENFLSCHREHELYYDSSDLTSSNEMLSKVVNTTDSEVKHLNVSNQSNDSSDYYDNTILTEVSLDPLGLVDYDQYGPILVVDDADEKAESGKTNSAPSSIVLPQKFPHTKNSPNFSNFKRSNRSIKPGKRCNQRVLVRSTSYDKQYLKEKMSENASFPFDIPQIYIVEDLHSPLPLSAQCNYLAYTTPNILINSADECVELGSVGTLPVSPDLTSDRRVFRRAKTRHSVSRRFSETQLFRHKKEKFLKQKEQQEKYSSCPAGSGNTDKIDSPRYIRTFVKRVSSLLHPGTRSRVLIKKDRGINFGSTSSVFLDYQVSRSII